MSKEEKTDEELLEELTAETDVVLWGPDKGTVHEVSMAEPYALSYLEESPGMSQEKFDDLLGRFKKTTAELKGKHE